MAKRHDKILAFAAKMMGINDNKRIVKQTAPEGVDVYDNIRYLEGDNPMHLLDVYKPQGVEETLPVIVDIHGGGWIYGTKDINKYFGMSLAKEGFVVVIILRIAFERCALQTVHNIVDNCIKF